MKHIIKTVLKEKNLIHKSFTYYDDDTFEIYNEDGTHVTLNKQEAGSLVRFIFSRMQYSK